MASHSERRDALRSPPYRLPIPKMGGVGLFRSGDLNGFRPPTNRSPEGYFSSIAGGRLWSVPTREGICGP
jgi:hypothetical protein